MEEDERSSGNKIIATIVGILLITIAILLWLLLKPAPEPEQIPTGNVDVFDIRIGCLCKNKDGKDCDDDDENKDEDGFIPDTSPGANSSSGGTNGYSEKKINGKTDTNVDEDGIVYVDDANGWYIYQKNLKVFQNAAFEYTNKIAPGVSNSYDFKVHNETKNSIRYSIEFDEKSEYAVNMLYRLKRAGKYVVGSDTKWVKSSELVSGLKFLTKDGVDNYTLDWKWPYEGGTDKADTKAGENMTSDYKLGIRIRFEEV